MFDLFVTTSVELSLPLPSSILPTDKFSDINEMPIFGRVRNAEKIRPQHVDNINIYFRAERERVEKKFDSLMPR